MASFLAHYCLNPMAFSVIQEMTCRWCGRSSFLRFSLGMTASRIGPFLIRQTGRIVHAGVRGKSRLSALFKGAVTRPNLNFAGMAGGKCVTMACNNRNTIGGCSVSLPFANRFLTHWRGSAKAPLCKG